MMKAFVMALVTCATLMTASMSRAQQLGVWEVNGIKLDGKACGSGVDVTGGVRVYKEGSNYYADSYSSYINACIFDNITPAVSVSFFEGNALIASVDVSIDTVPARGFAGPTARGGHKVVQLPAGHSLTRLDFKFVNTGTSSTAIKSLNPIGPTSLP